MAFKDNIVLITGASGGIGSVTAEQFAQQGAKVILVARNQEPLEKLKSSILAAGGEALAIPADVSVAEDVEKLAQQVKATCGRVDILVNMAAIAIKKTVLETSEEDWQALYNANLSSMFRVTRAFLPGMIERQSGVIINMSAAVGVTGFPQLGAYSATKAGVTAFSASLAKEVRRSGINVYSVSPHGVDTNLYHSLFGNVNADQLLSPLTVAQQILRVASGQSDLRSGSTLEITLEMVQP